MICRNRDKAGGYVTGAGDKIRISGSSLLDNKGNLDAMESYMFTRKP